MCVINYLIAYGSRTQWRRKGGGWGVSSPPNNDIGGAQPLLNNNRYIVQLLFLAREIARVYHYRSPVPAHLYKKSHRRRPLDGEKGGPLSTNNIHIASFLESYERKYN